MALCLSTQEGILRVTVCSIRSLCSRQIIASGNLIFSHNYHSPQKQHPTRECLIAIVPSPDRKRNYFQVDAAAQFTSASRPDLAEKERREADILSAFLPPLLTDSEIERILRDIVAKHKADDNSKRALGKVFKDFYAKVDTSAVDKGLVKDKAEILLSDAN